MDSPKKMDQGGHNTVSLLQALECETDEPLDFSLLLPLVRAFAPLLDAAGAVKVREVLHNFGVNGTVGEVDAELLQEELNRLMAYAPGDRESPHWEVAAAQAVIRFTFTLLDG